MNRLSLSPIRVFVLAMVFSGISAVASAASIPVGFIAWDVNIPASTGKFDIVNLTGPNTAPPDFPISTSVNLGSLSLTVNFVGGGTTVFGSSYFTLGPDGLSFDGNDIAIGGANPLPTSATLTGTFSPLSITVSGSGGLDGSYSILSTFSATILPDPGNPSLGRLGGEFAIINVTTTDGSTAPVPEPGTMVLLGTGVVGLFATQRRRIAARLGR